jgi:hypothetical protein
MAGTTQFTSGARSGGTSGPTGTAGGNGGIDPERMIETAKNMGNQVAGAVRDQATSLLDDQRNLAADQIVTVAGMVRNSVQSLDRQSAGAICRYAEDTAHQIEDFADGLRNRSWDELASDVEDFARRYPGVFMASAIGLGFIAGRFLVSSGSRARETTGTMEGTPAAAATSTMHNEPHLGARYNHGAGSGPVGDGAKSGHGAGGSTESF